MSYNPRPLQAVVISQQLPLLREVSWILEAVGYKVQTTTDFDQDAFWRRYSIADFVIVDGRNISEPTAETFAHDSHNPQYRIFLYDPAKHTDFAAWYAAGAHDALRAPISRGEVLARVRAGARYLEFERRLQYQSARCAVPGMLSRQGFLRKLRKLAASHEPGSSQNALLLTSIDWYAGIDRKCGDIASHCLVNTAARAIKRTAGENLVSAYLGEGRFATLLLGQTPASAKSIAESLAKDFGSRESHHESVPRPSLTSAIVPWTASSNADRFLRDALEALDLADHSGGGCVILESEFKKELSVWNENMSSGNPFADVIAQEIMEPFPAVLEHGAEQSELLAALSRSAVPVRPYVDRDGRLIGIAADDQAAADTQIDNAGSLDGDSLTLPQSISCDASFAEIYEAFSSLGCATLVVTAEDRPLGYLTCEGFLSMIDPIHAESFAQTDISADDLKYLVVPSTAGGPANEVAVSI